MITVLSQEARFRFRMVFGQSKNVLFHMLKMLHVNCVNVPFLEGPLLPFSVGISVITICLVL